jgi:tagaturonate reductase
MNDTIYDEIIPTLTLPKDDCMEFAAAVTERFKNPFIDHALLSITLNSTSKWKARVMPSFKGYVEKFGKLPKNITASLAFYIAFFAGITGSKDNYKITENGLMAMNGDREYAIKDDAPVLEFYAAHKDDDSKTLSKAVLSNESFWGEDLSAYEGLTDKVAELLDRIKAEGAYEVFKSL